MRIKNTKAKQRILTFKTVLRWLLYFVLIFLSFIYMTSGTWRKPVLLIPIALCISMNSGQISSAFTGAACGFLIDISSGKLFGYNAVILSFFCIFVSLMFELYLRNKFINIMLCTAAVSFILGWLDYKFYYEIWNYDNVEKIFTDLTIPVWIYTIISTVFVYLLIRLINHFLMPKEHLSIEEAVRSSIRS